MKTLISGRFLFGRLSNASIRFTALVSVITLALLLAACDVDSPDEGEKQDVEQDSFQWNAPWRAGESRSVNITHEVTGGDLLADGLTDEERENLDLLILINGLFGGGRVMGQVGESRLTVIELESDGSTIEFQILPVPIDSILNPETFLTDEFRTYFASNTGFTARMSVGPSGSIEQVQITDDLLSDVTDADIFFSEIMVPGPLRSPGLLQPGADEYARLMETESGLDLIEALVETRAGGLFLIRPGEYVVGEKVRVERPVPQMIPQFMTGVGPDLMFPADVEYRLNAISDGIAYFDISISKTLNGVYEVYRSSEDAVATALEYEFSIPEEDDEEFRDYLVSYLASSETKLIHLQVDIATGWPLSAEWTESYNYSEAFGEQGEQADVEVTYTATFQ